MKNRIGNWLTKVETWLLKNEDNQSSVKDIPQQADISQQSEVNGQPIGKSVIVKKPAKQKPDKVQPVGLIDNFKSEKQKEESNGVNPPGYDKNKIIQSIARAISKGVNIEIINNQQIVVHFPLPRDYVKKMKVIPFWKYNRADKSWTFPLTMNIMNEIESYFKKFKRVNY